MRRADGSWRHVEGIATNLLDEEHVEALVLTVRDVHERRAFEEELRHRAFHDSSPGCPTVRCSTTASSTRSGKRARPAHRR